ncbi:RICIN domain-containing protein [Rhodocytophaga aerolata]|uniref:RICIN domain-containing protein n=1 Tax=Rhodocytophaga aerolata TaxID=455078 RepID=A0ABT8RCF7_9BACT|nr:RICIN domain-containing protein [Rhodocytophaga aerolata]MDO1449780.1 RICIN domain-containing protein [Rhodocytophaga aerolata]
MPKLRFIPSRDGFHFVNNFTNHVGPITTYGLCGGMALAAFNYYRHSLPVPTHKQGVNDFGTLDDLPPEGGRLREYIFWQQMGSFASAAGFFFPSWPWLSDSDVLRDHYRASVGDFDRIKRAIDHNQFLLLGLRSSERGNLIGHQVLAYGYEENPLRIYIYDPNHPDQEMMLEADPGRERIVHKHGSGQESHTALSYGSYFVQLELNPLVPDLLTEASRPTYLDLGMASGIRVSAPIGDGLRQVGERLEIEATIRNYGDHPAHLRHLLLWARDPQNRNRDGDLGTGLPITTLAPGEEVRLHKVIERFGEQAGRYRFGVSYLSEHGHWILLPTLAPATSSEVNIDLVSGIDPGTHYGTGGYKGPGTYIIQARHSGKVFDVNIDWFSGANNGRPLIQFDRHGGDNQRFIVEPMPDGYVCIRAKHSGKCLDLEGFALSPLARLQQWECHRGDNQQFAIEPIGDHYRIRLKHSGMYLDVHGGSLDNGARMVQYPWHGGNNQLFQFIAAS